MYRTYLILDDFLAQREQIADGRVFVQPSRRSQALHGGVVAAVTSTILITALTHEAGNPIILAARVVVEAAELWQDTPSSAAALNSRASDAGDLIRAALRAAGLHVEPGVLLEPGMFDDLTKFHAEHDLWHFVGDAHDIAHLRLVAGPRLRAASEE